MRAQATLLVALVVATLLAGCAGGAQHGAHGEPGVLLDVLNQGTQPVTLRLQLQDKANATAWEENVTLDAGKSAARKIDLDAAEPHTLLVSWSDTEGLPPEAIDFGCGALVHLTLTWKDGAGAIARECH